MPSSLYHASEKLFKADKSFLGNRSLRVYTGQALEGKMLIAFVALIIRNRMYTKLKAAEEEMVDAVIKSKRSYSEIMAFIKGMPADED